MKLKIYAFGLSILLAFSVSAQEKSELKRSIGLTFSNFGSSDVFNSSGQTLDGGPSYNGKNYYTLGLSYVQPIRSWIDIESGIEFSKHTLTVSPMGMPGFYPQPYDKEISLINIPVSARVNFLKYFFANGGLMLEFETGNSSPIDKQTGIGSLFGLGAKFNFNNGLGAFVNAYTKTHALIPFSAKNDDHRWEIIEAGLRIGISYSF